jgi:Sjoegren syndrome nuclear autoantigen 1
LPVTDTMAGAGSLTAYNSELVKCIEDLREQREELNRSILRDEEDKARIQKVRVSAELVLHASHALARSLTATGHAITYHCRN